MSVQAPPEHIGHYRIDSVLGRGGMGEVYLAWDERLRRNVALKRVRADGPAGDAQRARFRREARAAARMSHPAIVQIFDILEDTGAGDCIVMEYVAGTTLGAMVSAGPLAPALAVRLAAQIAGGLGEAHAKGIVHRDLKGTNVIVTPAGQARILDFGLARSLFGDGDESALSRDGLIVGTVHAMSPEQASGRPVDHRSDLFSFGVLLYELLSGRTPFRGADAIDTLRRIGVEPPPPLRPLRPGLPEELYALVDRLLEKDPAHRPPNARMVEGELLRIAALPLSETPAPVDGPAAGVDPLGETASRVEPQVPAAVEAPAPAGSDARGRSSRPAVSEAISGQEAAREVERRELQALAGARRWRRTAAAVAAGAAILLVVAGAFAASALRAREDADRRRRQAEKLVGFMLGDLREKLEPEGRLAILKDVGDQAIEYFAAIPESSLSPEEQLLRSKALAQIGQARFGLGDLDGAERAFSESLSLARRLGARDPANEEWQFGLGQSEFWNGFLRLRRSDWKGAREHFQGYLDASNLLVARNPRKPEWRLELAYAHSNLASVDEATGDAASAGRALGASVSILETLLAESPDDERLADELAHVYAKLGAVEKQRGRLAESLGWFRKNAATREGLSKRRPDDVNLLRFLGMARGHVGDLLRFTGDTSGALAEYEAELDLAKRVADRDPENVAWRADLILRHDKLGRCRRARGEWAEAMKHLEAGRQLARALAAGAPDRSDHRFALAYLGESIASVLLATGRARQAESELGAAVAALDALVAEAPGDREMTQALGVSLWRLGEVKSALGETAAARAAWERALSVAGKLDNRDPRALEVAARALLSLGRREEARPVLAALDAMGFREEELARFRARAEAAGK